MDGRGVIILTSWFLMSVLSLRFAARCVVGYGSANYELLRNALDWFLEDSSEPRSSLVRLDIPELTCDLLCTSNLGLPAISFMKGPPAPICSSYVRHSGFSHGLDSLMFAQR
ncbi:uncharacterized protein EI90DRAFT_1398943 [Cantharellus anzutake]|uniref:uncharacterized protein n=1 Tax=Cantharellus anzutake TaxID=1750568 RepID=UPI00190488DD|nr:uncharacterized protein EI90DRAFT_1398943 [Cantharellus anzutake]KAF8329464.1 hypothetical protein EI90DRAFT_1398943 [Cantharellus anzutake]